MPLFALNKLYRRRIGQQARKNATFSRNVDS